LNANIAWKIRRLRAREQPRVLDLFSGCGGLSLGAQLAGCEILGGIELDEAAASSHALNFHSDLPEELRLIHGTPKDITKQDASAFIKDIRPSSRIPEREVDLLVGGPPCQSFARIGRAKLREVMEHPDAFLHDPRSGLYKHYIRFVETLKPLIVIVENVPDVLNYGGLNVFEMMAISLSEHGYRCRYGMLNSVHYGVPQMRTRCFLIGFHQGLEACPRLPAPTRKHRLPLGYNGTVRVAMKEMDMFSSSHFADAPAPDKDVPKAITAHEAIGDLPAITDHLSGNMKKGPQRLDKPVKLDATPISGYSRFMRHWLGFESDGFVYDHVIRFLPRDYKIFARMSPGDQYPEAHSLALRMRDDEVARVERNQKRKISEKSKLYREITKAFVPPYSPNKFPNKWRKMASDEPTRTIMAHIGKDSYSHIHYDDNQARTISVREAARLQSFPDGFKFCGTMNPAFRQIGNSVPPLLAFAVISRAIGDVTSIEFPSEVDFSSDAKEAVV